MTCHDTSQLQCSTTLLELQVSFVAFFKLSILFPPSYNITPGHNCSSRFISKLSLVFTTGAKVQWLLTFVYSHDRLCLQAVFWSSVLVYYKLNPKYVLSLFILPLILTMLVYITTWTPLASLSRINSDDFQFSGFFDLIDCGTPSQVWETS